MHKLRGNKQFYHDYPGKYMINECILYEKKHPKKRNKYNEGT